MLLPPEAAIGRIIGDMSSESDFIVVLSQLPQDRNEKLLERFPAIDLIVEGHDNKKLESPLIFPGGVIVSPGTYGEFVGLVTLVKSGNSLSVKRSELLPVIDYPVDKKANKIVLEYYKKRK